MGKIVAVANQKGGVGKTTLAIHLAAYLSRQGKRVVVVDADPQANATSWLTGGNLSEAGMFRLLVVEDPIAKVVRLINGKWKIGLLPSNVRTSEAMTFLSSTGKPFDTIARAIRPLANVADYVLIDMPPSRGAGFAETLYAADLVLVPTQLERMSLEGVTFMAQSALQLTKERQHGPRLLGVVPNMARHTIEHRDQLQALLKVFGQTVWPPIPHSIRVAEAASFGSTVFDHAPDESVTKSLILIGQRFVENVEG